MVSGLLLSRAQKLASTVSVRGFEEGLMRSTVPTETDSLHTFSCETVEKGESLSSTALGVLVAS